MQKIVFYSATNFIEIELCKDIDTDWLDASYMSLTLRKTCLQGFRLAHIQTRLTMTRGLKFLIKEVEGLFYLCSENKGNKKKAISNAYLIPPAW